MKRNIKNILFTLLGALIIYYFMLPPINLQARGFWVYIIVIMVLYLLLSMGKTLKSDVKVIKVDNVSSLFKVSKLIFVIGGIILAIIIINFIYSPLLNAKQYATRITIDEAKDFTDGVEEVNWDSVPLLDKDSSRKLGDRTMGNITDLVSQFYVSELYTQINYKNNIIRVTPLEYADVIKYFTNRSKGVEGYITVNSVNGESKLIRLAKGMKYMPSSLFFENLNRKLRFSYPTKVFGDISFEIDEEGKPFWIVPTIKYKGVGLRKDVEGVIIFDPVDGSSTYYKVGNVPSWVDHVYSADLIIEQVDNWGEYSSGFLNSIFGQKNVINTTEGYNYLAMHDDIYMYTGITSVSTDESNLGFILTNLRTKETNYYLVAGAEEYSAMASAEGLVQEKNYQATFPLLINLNNKPTYLLSLKDNAGLVKMYAFVDVVDYQRVVTSDASLGIEVAAKKYLGETEFNTHNLIEATIEVKTITSAVLEGTTYYYLTDKENNYYSVSIKTNQNFLPFVKVGDILKISYYPDDVRTIIKLEK